MEKQRTQSEIVSEIEVKHLIVLSKLKEEGIVPGKLPYRRELKPSEILAILWAMAPESSIKNTWFYGKGTRQLNETLHPGLKEEHDKADQDWRDARIESKLDDIIVNQMIREGDEMYGDGM